jgi:hypothetical protein
MIYTEREKLFKPTMTPTPASAMDYADALFRLLRMTGFFTVSKGRIVIAPERANDVDAILAERWPLSTDWDDPAAFYAHFGDAARPALPWQDTEMLRERVHALLSRASAALQAATFAVPATAMALLPTEGEVKTASYGELQAQYERTTETLKQIQQAELLGTLRSSEGMRQVGEFFDNITRRGDPLIFDAPSQLEWNVFRALLALDHTDNVKANLTMDTNLQPLTRAPGNGPDGIASFDGFDVIYEPTLKTGPRQWNDEREPIYRHAILHTNAVRDKGDNRDIYTLAIAPKIEPALAATFLNTAKGLLRIPGMREDPLIVPITIKQMQQLLAAAARVQGFRPEEIWFMFERIKEGAGGLAAGDCDGYSALIQGSVDQMIAEALNDHAAEPAA